MEESRQLKEILAEAIDDKNFGVKKLSETTGIHERHIKLFLEGELSKLPPAPYVRGYLTKISQTLGLDRDELFRIYKNEVENQKTSSGPADRLPSNRFAIKSRGKTFIFLTVLVLAVVTYLIWNANKLIGAPYLEVTLPDRETITTDQSSVVIEGKTDFSNKLTINGEQIYLEKDGHFQKEYDLQEGLNNFEIIAKKFLGRDARIVKKVIMQTAVEEIKSNIEQLKIEENSSSSPSPLSKGRRSG